MRVRAQANQLHLATVAVSGALHVALVLTLRSAPILVAPDAAPISIKVNVVPGPAAIVLAAPAIGAKSKPVSRRIRTMPPAAPTIRSY